jgi:hypothetical protein
MDEREIHRWRRARPVAVGPKLHPGIITMLGYIAMVPLTAFAGLICVAVFAPVLLAVAGVLAAMLAAAAAVMGVALLMIGAGAVMLGAVVAAARIQKVFTGRTPDWFVALGKDQTPPCSTYSYSYTYGTEDITDRPRRRFVPLKLPHGE